METHRRHCPACFAPLGLFERRCPDCGYDGKPDAVQRIPLGMRLQGRYRVGRALNGAYLGFDSETGERVRLEPYYGNDRTAFFRRADALLRVSDCVGLIAVTDAFEDAGAAFCVHAMPDGVPLPLRPFPLTEKELLTALNDAADALLVLHSIPIPHGSLTADRVYVSSDGRARLLTAAAPGGGIADDLRMLGLLFLPVHGTIHKRFDTVLEGLATGRYTSALELRHALGCLAGGRSA